MLGAWAPRQFPAFYCRVATPLLLDKPKKAAEMNFMGEPGVGGKMTNNTAEKQQVAERGKQERMYGEKIRSDNV